jgi:hypothetical protein
MQVRGALWGLLTVSKPAKHSVAWEYTVVRSQQRGMEGVTLQGTLQLAAGPLRKVGAWQKVAVLVAGSRQTVALLAAQVNEPAQQLNGSCAARWNWEA